MTEPVPPTLTSTTTLDGTPVVAFTGEVDVATHERFSAAVLAAAAGGPAQVTVDLTEVTFFDSSAVSALLVARGSLAESGTALVVGEVSAIVRRTLEIVGLYDLVRRAEGLDPD